MQFTKIQSFKSKYNSVTSWWTVKKLKNIQCTFSTPRTREIGNMEEKYLGNVELYNSNKRCCD
jgi:hypothetical protein